MPGMGLKCLRDNTDSGNFVAMWQLDGITDKISVKSSLAELTRHLKLLTAIWCFEIKLYVRIIVASINSSHFLLWLF